MIFNANIGIVFAHQFSGNSWNCLLKHFPFVFNISAYQSAFIYCLTIVTALVLLLILITGISILLFPDL